ncbi:MAG TPA: DoxX family protein [Chitinophagaceae bacterium]|nr:DoxX family protein [Chitinophagaceae bacterium]
MIRLQPYIQLYLRLALAAGYLKLGFDRLGLWGPYGKPFVSWGDWKHFMEYAGQVMGFLPAGLVEVLAVTATVAEILFGILLLAGKWTRAAATGSGILTLMFAIAMAVSNGVQDPIGYSVFTVSAASFLLATLPSYKWSMDNLK